MQSIYILRIATFAYGISLQLLLEVMEREIQKTIFSASNFLRVCVGVQVKCQSSGVISKTS